VLGWSVFAGNVLLWATVLSWDMWNVVFFSWFAVSMWLRWNAVSLFLVWSMAFWTLGMWTMAFMYLGMFNVAYWTLGMWSMLVWNIMFALRDTMLVWTMLMRTIIMFALRLMMSMGQWSLLLVVKSLFQLLYRLFDALEVMLGLCDVIAAAATAEWLAHGA